MMINTGAEEDAVAVTVEKENKALPFPKILCFMRLELNSIEYGDTLKSYVTVFIVLVSK